jgi:hypothetical protein
LNPTKQILKKKMKEFGECLWKSSRGLVFASGSAACRNCTPTDMEAAVDTFFYQSSSLDGHSGPN